MAKIIPIKDIHTAIAQVKNRDLYSVSLSRDGMFYILFRWDSLEQLMGFVDWQAKYNNNISRKNDVIPLDRFI